MSDNARTGTENSSQSRGKLSRAIKSLKKIPGTVKRVITIGIPKLVLIILTVVVFSFGFFIGERTIIEQVRRLANIPVIADNIYLSAERIFVFLTILGMLVLLRFVIVAIIELDLRKRKR